MDEKSEGGRENGGGNGTNDTKEEETTLAADSRDTENGVTRNVADGIKTEGPEAVPEAETTPEEPSGTVPSKSGSAQPTAEPESQEDTRGMKTKADEEVKEPYDEAQNATEDKNIAQGKTDQTNASNSEKQPNLDCSQAAPGTDQVETSRAVQYQDGGPPQTAADSLSELAGNKGIKEPNDKTPDAPRAQSIKRNNMEDSSSNGTQKPLPGSGAEGQREAVQTSDSDSVTSPSKAVQPNTTRSDPLTDNRKSSPSGAGPDPDTEYAPPKGSEQTYEEERGGPQITDSSSELKETNPKTVVPVAGPGTATKGAPGNYSGQIDKEEKGDPQKTDSSSKSKRTNSKKVEPVAGPDTATKGAPGNYSGQTDREEKGDPKKTYSSSNPKGNNSKKVEPVAGPDTATIGASGNHSGQTDREEKGDPQKTYSSSKPKETKPTKVLPGAKLDPYAERATRERSGKTDKEKEREPKKNESSSKPNKNNPKTVPCNPPPNPTTPDSGSKDRKDKEGARERKTKEMSEEEKRATENKANELKLSKKGAAAAGNGTKEDGTTKQRFNEKKVKHVSKERPVSISVCTSAYEFNVKGLVSFLEDHQKDHPELIKEVKVHALPYNDLDHYKFSKENPVDVMLLCHSINNRRFAITDVMDALYDEYLPYCATVVGKNKMGVIVHDFDDMNEAVQSSRMGSFSYKQPKAFETTSLQIICGQIEKKEQVLKQMQKVDRAKVLEFLKNASTFPEEMIEEMNADPCLFEVATKFVKKKRHPLIVHSRD